MNNVHGSALFLILLAVTHGQMFMSPTIMSGFPRDSGYLASGIQTSYDSSVTGQGSMYGGPGGYSLPGSDYSGGYAGNDVMGGLPKFPVGGQSGNQVGYGFGLVGSSLDAALATSYYGVGDGGGYAGSSKGGGGYGGYESIGKGGGVKGEVKGEVKGGGYGGVAQKGIGYGGGYGGGSSYGGGVATQQSVGYGKGKSSYSGGGGIGSYGGSSYGGKGGSYGSKGGSYGGKGGSYVDTSYSGSTYNTKDGYSNYGSGATSTYDNGPYAATGSSAFKYPKYSTYSPKRTGTGTQATLRDLNSQGTLDSSKGGGTGFNNHFSILDNIVGGSNMDVVLPRSQTAHGFGPATRNGVIVPSIENINDNIHSPSRIHNFFEAETLSVPHFMSTLRASDKMETIEKIAAHVNEDRTNQLLLDSTTVSARLPASPVTSTDSHKRIHMEHHGAKAGQTVELPVSLLKSIHRHGDADFVDARRYVVKDMLKTIYALREVRKEFNVIERHYVEHQKEKEEEREAEQEKEREKVRSMLPPGADEEIVQGIVDMKLFNGKKTYNTMQLNSKKKMKILSDSVSVEAPLLNDRYDSIIQMQASLGFKEEKLTQKMHSINTDENILISVAAGVEKDVSDYVKTQHMFGMKKIWHTFQRGANNLASSIGLSGTGVISGTTRPTALKPKEEEKSGRMLNNINNNMNSNSNANNPNNLRTATSNNTSNQNNIQNVSTARNANFHIPTTPSIAMTTGHVSPSPTTGVAHGTATSWKLGDKIESHGNETKLQDFVLANVDVRAKLGVLPYVKEIHIGNQLPEQQKTAKIITQKAWMMLNEEKATLAQEIEEIDISRQLFRETLLSTLETRQRRLSLFSTVDDQSDQTDSQVLHDQQEEEIDHMTDLQNELHDLEAIYIERDKDLWRDAWEEEAENVRTIIIELKELDEMSALEEERAIAEIIRETVKEEERIRDLNKRIEDMRVKEKGKLTERDNMVLNNQIIDEKVKTQLDKELTELRLLREEYETALQDAELSLVRERRRQREREDVHARLLARDKQREEDRELAREKELDDWAEERRNQTNSVENMARQLLNDTLLANKPNLSRVDADGNPRRLNRVERRMLKEKELEGQREELIEEWEKEKMRERDLLARRRQTEDEKREQDLLRARRSARGIGDPNVYGRGFAGTYLRGEYIGGSSAYGAPGGPGQSQSYSKRPVLDKTAGGSYESISYVPVDSRPQPGYYTSYESYMATSNNNAYNVDNYDWSMNAYAGAIGKDSGENGQYATDGYVGDAYGSKGGDIYVGKNIASYGGKQTVGYGGAAYGGLGSNYGGKQAAYGGSYGGGGVYSGKQASNYGVQIPQGTYGNNKQVQFPSKQGYSSSQGYAGGAKAQYPGTQRVELFRRNDNHFVRSMTTMGQTGGVGYEDVGGGIGGYSNLKSINNGKDGYSENSNYGTSDIYTEDAGYSSKLPPPPLKYNTAPYYSVGWAPRNIYREKATPRISIPIPSYAPYKQDYADYQQAPTGYEQYDKQYMQQSTNNNNGHYSSKYSDPSHKMHYSPSMDSSISEFQQLGKNQNFQLGNANMINYDEINQNRGIVKVGNSQYGGLDAVKSPYSNTYDNAGSKGYTSDDIDYGKDAGYHNKDSSNYSKDEYTEEKRYGGSFDNKDSYYSAYMSKPYMPVYYKKQKSYHGQDPIYGLPQYDSGYYGLIQPITYGVEEYQAYQQQYGLSAQQASTQEYSGIQQGIAQEYGSSYNPLQQREHVKYHTLQYTPKYDELGYEIAEYTPYEGLLKEGEYVGATYNSDARSLYNPRGYNRDYAPQYGSYGYDGMYTGNYAYNDQMYASAGAFQGMNNEFNTFFPLKGVQDVFLELPAESTQKKPKVDFTRTNVPTTETPPRSNNPQDLGFSTRLDATIDARTRNTGMLLHKEVVDREAARRGLTRDQFLDQIREGGVNLSANALNDEIITRSRARSPDIVRVDPNSVNVNSIATGLFGPDTMVTTGPSGVTAVTDNNTVLLAHASSDFVQDRMTRMDARDAVTRNRAALSTEVGRFFQVDN